MPALPRVRLISPWPRWAGVTGCIALLQGRVSCKQSAGARWAAWFALEAAAAAPSAAADQTGQHHAVLLQIHRAALCSAAAELPEKSPLMQQALAGAA